SIPAFSPPRCSTLDRRHHLLAHKLLKPIHTMKCLTITALCGAVLASTIGAMNVIIKGNEPRPTVPEDALVSVISGPPPSSIEGPNKCNVCDGKGRCRYCLN
ncbi:hypothetical protein PSTG_04907, partial [Puccinia striiformis f. sp. tritici PST-78]